MSDIDETDKNAKLLEERESGRDEAKNDEEWQQKTTANRLRNGANILLFFLVVSVILISWILWWDSASRPPRSGLAGSNQGQCESPVQRREWRQLSQAQQRGFLEAVQCLARRPSLLNNHRKDMKGGGNSSRYDDFVWVHIQLYKRTHNVAPSFPWHRRFIKVFEETIQKECGYRGSLPYWDWTLDAENPAKSLIWNKEFGFGGNGTGKRHCVCDGPFKDWVLRWPVKHCLRRRFSEGMYGLNYTRDVVRRIRASTRSYNEFRRALESNSHKSVHNGIGGEMPTHDSPNDPIFWLHHGQIDRLWWLWQNDDLSVRLEDYEGPRIEKSDVLDAELNDKLLMLGLANDVLVEEMMDTRGESLCYGY